jgi:hypothetical protein
VSPRTFKTEAGLRAFLSRYEGRGATFHVVVQHDPGCSRSVCTCEPWYVVRPATPETVRDGTQRQARWEKETAS